eukprot:scaffold39838_cov70-Phaeocystis_antarctica.AAC.5
MWWLTQRRISCSGSSLPTAPRSSPGSARRKNSGCTLGVSGASSSYEARFQSTSTAAAAAAAAALAAATAAAAVVGAAATSVLYLLLLQQHLRVGRRLVELLRL